MSSKIEQLIDEIEEYIDTCKYQPLSKTNIVVNKEEIDELLRELRMKAILNDARQKAEALINEATVHTNELINEHEIMQQAYAQANEVVTLASKQAQEILDNATIEANNVRSAAMQYMDDMLANLEGIITQSMETASGHYQGLLSSLGKYNEIIKSNRNELHPVEDDDLENVVLSDDKKSDKLDLM